MRRRFVLVNVLIAVGVPAVAVLGVSGWRFARLAMDPMGVAGGVRLVYRVDAPRRRALPPGPNQAGVVERTADVVRQRIKAYNRRASVHVDRNQLEVLIPDVGDMPPIEGFKRLIERSGRLEFKMVDDGSAYMKAVAVAAYRAHSPGVTVEPESWNDNNGQGHEDLFLAGEAFDKLAAAVDAVVRDQPVPENHQILLERRASDWRTYYVHTQIHVDNADVRSADQVWSDEGEPEVAIELTPSGSERISALTERSVGRKLALVFEDRVLMAAVILGKIPGRLRIHLDKDKNQSERQREAKDLVMVLRSQPLPARLVLLSEDTVAPRR